VSSVGWRGGWHALSMDAKGVQATTLYTPFGLPQGVPPRRRLKKLHSVRGFVSVCRIVCRNPTPEVEP